MTNICPCCKRALPKAKIVNVESVDTSAMNDRELFAYYKRTAPASDLAFLRANVHNSETLNARIDAIAVPTRDDITLLREAWRIERANADKWARWEDVEETDEQTEAA